MRTKTLLALVLMAQLAPVFAVDATYNTVGLSTSIVNQAPDPAVAGDLVEVRLGVQNTGGQAASNLILELVPSYPFTLVPGESATQPIGTIQGYQGQYDSNLKIAKYTLQVDKNAIAGNYTIKARTYQEGSNAIQSQDTLHIDVTSTEHAEVIRIDKSVLAPGAQSSLKFTINNVGNAPLRSLTFNWDNADKIILPVGSDNTRYVPYLEVGGSAELDYQVIADSNANPGLYKLDLNLAYADPVTGAKKQTSTIAGVYVGGGTDFDAAFSESSSGQTSFTIANIGSNPASSVMVSIPEQRGWVLSGSSSFMIGNLNKGDYTVASFNLQSALQNITANRTRNPAMNFTGIQARNGTQETVRLQIAYTDTMGSRQVVEKEVKMGAQSRSATGLASLQGRTATQSQSILVQYQYYIIGIAALAILLVAYRRHESRKLHHAGLTSDDASKRGLTDRKK